ncbi:hypothetical protein [Mycolicibacter virginiensis]|uniref:hypothetical protein n=1 Tax=Mycolicibacter virginiensis TaxID=1795032 RepID=UPI0013FD4B96|nr:hypothetical protein [Mycolicibacter virginiensis]
MTYTQRPTAIDKARAGLSFIEVLFALVVARVLDPFAHYMSIPAAGFSHLGVALVLTVTSWIGYHNSWNRPRYFIRFANLPLWQFFIDVLLVAAYWFCAVSAEGTGTDLGREISARPESVCVAISFVLYCFWDWVGYGIRRSALYPKSPPRNDVPRRRHVTYICTTIAIGIAGMVCLIDPTCDCVVVGIDLALIALILGFRFAKEAPSVTPESAYAIYEEENGVDD